MFAEIPRRSIMIELQATCSTSGKGALNRRNDPRPKGSQCCDIKRLREFFHVFRIHQAQVEISLEHVLNIRFGSSGEIGERMNMCTLEQLQFVKVLSALTVGSLHVDQCGDVQAGLRAD